jgi:hypothetical protein
MAIAALYALTLLAPFNDVRDAPASFLDTVEDAVSEMTDELGISEQVVDVVIVGSYAYGIARLDDAQRVSDVDIVVYARGLSKDPTQYLAGYAAFRDAAMRYRLVLQARLGTDMDFDIKADTRDLATHVADHDWIGFSLRERRFYNRDDGQPRSVKGHFYKDVYYLFDRVAYQAYMKELPSHRYDIHTEVEGDQVVFYDGTGWARGEHVELLRSFHKRAGGGL